MIKYEDDEIIGDVKGVFDYFQDELCQQIKNLSLDGENFDIEIVNNNSKLILELLNALYQDIITDNLTRDTKIRVIDDPMGQLYYEKVEA